MQAVGQHNDEDDGRCDTRQEIDVLAEQPHAATQPDNGDGGGDRRDDHERGPAQEEPAQA